MELVKICNCLPVIVSSIPGSDNETVYTWVQNNKVNKNRQILHISQTMETWRWSECIWLKHCGYYNIYNNTLFKILNCNLAFFRKYKKYNLIKNTFAFFLFFYLFLASYKINYFVFFSIKIYYLSLLILWLAISFYLNSSGYICRKIRQGFVEAGETA